MNLLVQVALKYYSGQQRQAAVSSSSAGACTARAWLPRCASMRAAVACRSAPACCMHECMGITRARCRHTRV